MSDSLKERLSSHSNSFEGLLSLIPARYYYDDESNSQWKKGAANAEERKAEYQNARKNKFDPEVGSSALDEIKRREQSIASTDGAEEEEQDLSNVIIYDDHGNPIGDKVETIDELLRSKAQAPPEKTEQHRKQQPKKEKSETKPKNTKETHSSPHKPSTDSKPKKESVAQKNSNTEASDGPLESDEADVSEEKAGRADVKKPKQGIEELRARLAAKVSELRTKRKAPGSNAEGAPKNREELLAARKLRLEQKKSQAAKREETHEDDEDEDEDEDEDSDTGQVNNERGNRSTDLDSNLIFGQLQFNDGARLGRDGRSLEEQNRHKKRNAIDQLRVLENRKSKISKLDKAKQDEIAENAKWSRAILQSEGAKIRDDEKLLRKTIKQKQNRKKRSEKEWKQRIYNVKKGISDREAKRHANIRAHKDAKKLRLKGKKRRQHMKAATSNVGAQK